MFLKYYNLIMDVNKNGLSNLPNMVKFQLISDLHLEKFKVLPNVEEIITPSAPNLILAGDICYVKHKNFVPFFEKISETFGEFLENFG